MGNRGRARLGLLLTCGSERGCLPAWPPCPGRSPRAGCRGHLALGSQGPAGPTRAAVARAEWWLLPSQWSCVHGQRHCGSRLGAPGEPGTQWGGRDSGSAGFLGCSLKEAECQAGIF